MTCEEEVMLNALLDGELDAVHARQVEEHVASCPTCAAQLRDYRVMRGGLAGAQMRYAAPRSLRTRVDARWTRRTREMSRRSLLQGFAAGTAATTAVAAAGVFLFVRSSDETRLFGEVVSAHLRSLQGNHLTDVVSSDQHTVKPWFAGRLDLAPPVVDLTAQGFTLLGGRLDYVDARPVAVIVYRRRTHVINLFVAQAGGDSPAKRSTMQQGYNIRRWRERDLDLIAVSDITADELQEFADKFSASLNRSS